MNRKAVILVSLIFVLSALVGVGFIFSSWWDGSGTAQANIDEQGTQTAEMQSPSTEIVQPTLTPTPSSFDGERAYQDVLKQVSFGPRLPGSEAHEQMVTWLQEELTRSGWEVELQETTYQNQPVRNVIARRSRVQSGSLDRPWIILGAHYDSRFQANQEQDPELQDDPVPGANDGASGVAVLLDLARVLPRELEQDIWLVFFDVEDQGNLPGWDWILGSRAFAESLEEKPDSVVIVDMVGDADLNLYLERTSNQEIANEIWSVAAKLGHEDVFIPEPKYSILDDHTPFLELGIPAVDIIDFDYPYWHTVEDTADKVSPDSLHVVGETLFHWLVQSQP